MDLTFFGQFVSEVTDGDTLTITRHPFLEIFIEILCSPFLLDYLIFVVFTPLCLG